MNKEWQDYLSVSWKNVLSSKEDIIKLFMMLNIQCLKDIQILSRTYANDGRMIVIKTADNIENKKFRIIIDAAPGIPTWQQF